MEGAAAACCCSTGQAAPHSCCLSPPRSVALWICGFCGNANPGCPYRPTRSGGYRIFVPEGGPLSQRYPGTSDCAAPGVGPDLRDMCQKAGFTPAETQL